MRSAALAIPPGWNSFGSTRNTSATLREAHLRHRGRGHCRASPPATSRELDFGTRHPPRKGRIGQHTLGTSVPGWPPPRFQRKTRSGRVWTSHGLQRHRRCRRGFSRELGEGSGHRQSVVVVARPASGSVRPMGDGWQSACHTSRSPDCSWNVRYTARGPRCSRRGARGSP